MSDAGEQVPISDVRDASPDRYAIAKRTLIIFLPVCALLIAMMAFYLLPTQRHEMAFYRSEAWHFVDLQAATVDAEVQQAVSDLRLLSNRTEMKNLWDADGRLVPGVLANLTIDYLQMAKYRQLYDQVRLLEENGMEIVRIDVDDDRPTAVPRERLQNKYGRYYFRDSFGLDKGEVFVSPLDLNVERGEIEQPLKPMIRFATPVFDGNGRKRGVVLLNYLGAKLLQRFAAQAREAIDNQAMLLNADGYWLYGPRSEDEWGFMFEDRKDRSFANAHPDAWERIKTEEFGQFETPQGLFTTRTVKPLVVGQYSSTGAGEASGVSAARLNSSRYSWTIVSFTPAEALYAASNRRVRVAAAGIGILALLALLGSWRIATINGRRRLAERELRSARGQLEQRVMERTRELRESEALLNGILESMTDGVLVLDADFHYVFWNRKMEELSAVPRDQLVGSDLKPWDVFPHITEQGVDDLMRRAMANEIVSREDIPCRFPDGAEGYTSEIYLPLESSSGRTRGIIGVVHDTTQRKRIEQENLMLERQVQQTQHLESLGTLAGGMAHDFNNLLMAIMGNADLVLDALPPQSPMRDNLQGIEEASRRAAELTGQMLAYSGKGSFVLQPIDLSLLVEENTHLLEDSIPKNVVLQYDLAENLPLFDGDATQIRQVAMNLISNASEAIGRSSGVIALSTGAMHCDRATLDGFDQRVGAGAGDSMAEGVYVVLEVRDTGCGMDAETIWKIFDPFFTTKFTGRGLGMSAVLGIVRGHGGALEIASEPDEGTTCKVFFPANEHPGNDLKIKKKETGERREWRGSGTILLVDDEAPVRTVGKWMLERLGFSVLTASGGRQALKNLAAHSDEIVCVLLDLTMPHMDGEEAFYEMRRLQPDITVILCSGYSEEDVTPRFVGNGPAGFIQKPFKLITLDEKLSEVLLDGHGAPNGPGDMV